MNEPTALAVNTPASGTPRNRGINYLGNLGRVLRDLTGFTTLAFELLQNADDASARALQVDVGQDALVVFNDAAFSDCGDQDLTSENCLYIAGRGHRCDFHSFRDVASGDKRDRADTTGAFGIGFIAVYQVADRAVLISGGRRWDIDEMRPEASRIIETPAPDAVGTTFILPWARDPGSAFRQATSSAAVGPDDRQQLFDVLVALRAGAARANAAEAALASELDRAASGKITPYVSARESLLARRQAAVVHRDRANAGLKNWRSVDSRQRKVDRLAGELAELRREQRENKIRPDRQAVISAISGRFRKILTEWNYPKHEDTGMIDDKLVPYARTKPYRSASSGGQVLQTLAWILSIFEVAYEQQAHHPGFLLIDTPQKNLGGAAAADDEEFADVRLVERFYRHIADWLEREGRGAQIIVVDNTPPPVAVKYIVRSFTRDPDHGLYGLIDNEKG